MSTTFKEFIEKKASVQPLKLDVHKWKQSLNHLVDQIKYWLKESDPSGKHLKVIDGTRTISEEGLDDYDAPTLRIILGRDQVDFIPEALQSLYYLPKEPGIHMLRSAGVVKLTNGYDQIYLYRQDETNDNWIIVDHAKYQVTNFDRDKFETKLKELFS